MNVTTIRQTIFVKAKPQEVYDCFVNPHKHSDFTGSHATGSGKEGAKFTAWDGYIAGKNLKLQKGRKIIQEWKSTDFADDAEPSIFQLNLTKKGNGTEIKMIHSHVPAGLAKSLADGWKEFYWEPLKKYIASKQH